MILRKVYFLFLFFLFHLAVKAQQDEALSDLKYNQTLLEEVNQSKSISRAAAANIFFLNDTLSLPFIDDFSTNRLSDYYADQYPESAKRDSVHYSFRVDGALIDTFYYMDSTSWKYTFDPVTQVLDSFPKAKQAVTFYENLYSPSVATDTLIVWPSYYRYFKDGTGGVDSVFISPDHALILIIDTSVYINVSSKNALWINRQVFINNTFPYNPVTYGVATFEGLDSLGYPYDFSFPGDAHGRADHLTSKPIDLSEGDDIYLSFYYQPQGRGNAPEPEDSLILEFRGKPGDPWKKVWFRNGSSVAAGFKFEIIPVTDMGYRTKAFQFQFRNYATLSGNVDHWHIDYIRLDKNRDTARSTDDVAFIYPTGSLIKDYQAMPWRHYKSDPSIFMNKDFLYTKFRNLSNVIKNTTIQVEVKDRNFIPTNPPFVTNTSKNVNAASRDSLKQSLGSYTFPTDGSSENEIFYIVDSLHATPDYLGNNKVSYRQIFANYYAYDDGIAESGYGVQGTGAKIAYKFTTAIADTLRGVQIFFARAINDAAGANLTFKITVWDDAGGKPGNIIYQKSEADKVIYDQGLHNQFHGYGIDDLILNQGKTFYIGYVQTFPERINIGFDKNISATNKMYYNTSGTWYISQFSGAWMMRPVFGGGALVSVGEKQATTPAFPAPSFSIYPNPASNSVTFTCKNVRSISSMVIYDAVGKRVYAQDDINEIFELDVSAFNNGLYIIQLNHEAGSTIKKLIIAR